MFYCSIFSNNRPFRVVRRFLPPTISGNRWFLPYRNRPFPKVSGLTSLKPHIFVGAPRFSLKTPNIFIGDPKDFLLKTSKIFIRDPQDFHWRLKIFVLNPQFSLETSRILLKTPNIFNWDPNFLSETQIFSSGIQHFSF